MLFAVATIVALWVETEVRLWLPATALIPDLVLILAVDLGLKQHTALAPRCWPLRWATRPTRYRARSWV